MKNTFKTFSAKSKRNNYKVKLLSLGCIALFTSGTLNAQISNKPAITYCNSDSMINKSYHYRTFADTIDSKNYKIFNNNNVVFIAYYTNDGSNQFIPRIADSFMYNSNNSIIENIIFTFRDTAFIPTAKLIYTYNSSNQLVSMERLTYNRFGNNYNEDEKTTYTYDNGKIDEISYLEYNGTTNLYQANFKETYSYLPNDSISSITRSEYDPSTNRWTIIRRKLNTYNSNGTKNEIVFQNYNRIINVWVDNRKEEYKYFGSGNDFTIDYFDFNISDYTQHDSVLFNGNNVIGYKQNIYATATTIEPLVSYTFEYNDQNKVIKEIILSNYNNATNRYEKLNEHVYYCQTDATNIPKNKNYITNVYPNPVQAGSKLTIESTTNGSATLVDIMGRKQNTFDIKKGTNLIELNDIQKGIYFLQLQESTIKLSIY